jgi:hypothetical protein
MPMPPNWPSAVGWPDRESSNRCGASRAVYTAAGNMPETSVTKSAVALVSGDECVVRGSNRQAIWIADAVELVGPLT